MNRVLCLTLAVLLFCAPAYADGPGGVGTGIDQKFSGHVDGSGATTGQTLIKQANGDWIPGSISIPPAVWTRTGITLAPTTAGDLVSNPVGGAHSEVWGAGASGADYSTVLGQLANGTQTQTVVVGWAAKAGPAGTSIGYRAGTSGGNGSYSTLLGSEARDLGHNSCVAIGEQTANNADNQFASGSSFSPINHVVFGDGPGGSGSYSFTSTAGIDAITIATGGAVGIANLTCTGILTVNDAHNNTFVGSAAGGANTTGASNVALGYTSLNANQTGQRNIAIGGNALAQTTTDYVTGVGFDVLYANTSGTYNVGFGNSAGYEPAHNAANANVTGSNNTYLGAFTGADSATQRTNTSTVGYYALSTADNQVSLGNSSVTSILCGAGNASVTCADIHAAGTVYGGDFCGIRAGTGGNFQFTLGPVLASVANEGVSFSGYSGNPGWISASVRIVTKTANYTIVATDTGYHFDNAGASAQVAFTLPVSAAGLTCCFYVATAQNLRLIGNGSDTIRVGASVSTATTGHVDNATVGGWIMLECHATGQWVAIPVVGTWTVT